MKYTGMTVVVETIEIVFGSSDWTGIHLCDYGRCTIGMGTGTPLSDKGGRSNRTVPSDQVPLVVSADAASKELGCSLDFVDIASLSFLARIKEKLRFLPVPRVEIGDEYLEGIPTKDEIITFYRSIHSHEVDNDFAIEFQLQKQETISGDLVRE